MILVDSNILIDIIQTDPEWAAWSQQQLEAAASGIVAINQMVIAEVAPSFGSLEAFEQEMVGMGVVQIDFGNEAAYLAGNAYLAYRQNRGPTAPSLPLPDFFIGGHAQVLGATILTRDPRFYPTYFPEVALITPSKENQ